MLRRTLRRALTDKSAEDFYWTLSEMTAALHDGHGYVYGRSQSGGLPIRAEVIEGYLVITATGGETDFRRGDIIETIDGTAAITLLKERERFVSGSPQLRRYRALNTFGEGPVGSTARVGGVRNGEALLIETMRATDSRGFFTNPIVEYASAAIAEIRQGIWYVNLTSCDVASLQEKLPELAASRGLILDRRRNRSGPWPEGSIEIEPEKHIIPHLIDEPIDGPLGRIVLTDTPDRMRRRYRENVFMSARPQSPRITAPVVVINEPRVVSYGESTTALLAEHHLAKFVGGPTAGCNGVVNFTKLPGGFDVMWTGMEVMKHDRSRLYGIGYAPDYPVNRTIAAVIAGDDEYLAKAIAVIESHLLAK